MFHNSNWIELTNRESGSNRKYPRHRTVKYVEWNLGCKWNGIVDLRWKEMRFNDIGVISSIEAKRSWKSCCWLDRNARARYSLKRIEAMLPAITQRAPGKWKSNNRTQRRVAYKDSFAAALRMKIQSRRTDVGRWCRTLMSGDDVERWINRDGSYQPVFWFAPVCKMRFVRCDQHQSIWLEIPRDVLCTGLVYIDLVICRKYEQSSLALAPKQTIKSWSHAKCRCSLSISVTCRRESLMGHRQC